MERRKRWIVSMVLVGVIVAGCGEKHDKGEETASPAVSKAQAKVAVEKRTDREHVPPKEEAASLPAAGVAEKEAVTQKIEAVQKRVETEVAATRSEVEATVAPKESRIDAAALYTKCAGCHGARGEKHALGQSNVIGRQPKAELIKKIEGYKNGTFGGAMKGLMAGQVKNLTPEEIEALAEYIAKL